MAPASVPHGIVSLINLPEGIPELATAQTFLPVIRGVDTNPSVEPTFYLAGQPYIYDELELAKAGPELAEHALIETRQQLVRLNVLFHAGEVLPEEGRCLTREEFVRRATELAMGLAALSAVLAPYAPYARRAVKMLGLMAGHVVGVVLVTDPT